MFYRIVFSAALSFFITFAFANDELHTITWEGQEIKAQLEVKGQISLYSTQVAQAVPFSESYNPTDQETAFFILPKNGEAAIRLYRFNYKKILREHLASKPEIANQIGSKGYRYDDIQAILQAYNQK
jgi:hypothetical protein